MILLLCCGLLAVGSVFGEDEVIDFSHVQTRLQMENSVRWNGPPMGFGSPEVDSSEHGVRPGIRSTNCMCGWANRGSGRIVGGKVHAPNEYPFIAGVAHSHQPHRPHCGSAIISPWHILTAAHCTAGAQSLVVTVGDYDRSGRSGRPIVHRVRRIIDHEHYMPQIVRHDISFLFLETPIQQNAHVGPACLPTPGMNLVGQKVRIIGWGAMQFQGQMTTLPQKVDVRVIDMQTCSNAWQQMVLTNPATQVCTHSRRKTACQGDSGGPVVWLDPATNRYTLVGLVSFGPKCEDHLPSVQTSVLAFITWILQKIRETAPGQMTCQKI